MARTSNRFPGLDTLRFLAALFVVIGHIPMTQGSVGLPNPTWSAAFFRGAHAVCFFFTLSGFLITYLLLEEQQRTDSIDVRRFYLRRVFRIWPLYFAVTIFGLIFYNVLLPWLGRPYPVHYRIWFAALLYVAFLPNLMNSLYTVGGILNPLWSIGIEEQFYLAWAPAARRLRSRLPILGAVVLAAFFVLFVVNEHDVFGAGRAKLFVGQLKFDFMAVGALWAWAIHRHRDRVLALPIFRYRPLQLLLAALLAEHYFVGWLGRSAYVAEVLQLTLYGWLIVEVGVNPKNLLRFNHRGLEYLGTISYGIYMLHMPVIYATAELFRRTSWWRGHAWLYLASFYVLAVAGAIGAAALSYRFFERPFLRLKDRLGTSEAPGPPESLPLPTASANALS